MPRKPEVFDRPRWLVVCGPGQLEQHAAADAAALIQQHVPYVLQTHVGGCDRRRLAGHNLLIVGTPQSNELVAAAIADGKLRLGRRAQSCAIRTLSSRFNPKRQALVLAGRDERGVLYAARDFEHYCYDPWHGSLAGRSLPLPHVAARPRRAVPFHDRLPQWDLRSTPGVADRGIWTWGHVIYDYPRFLEHMSRWKLNTLICWNDHAPVNARAIVAAAHSLGIQVIWGYTWCWGEAVDPNDPAQLARWRRRVVRTYEEQYLPTGADGIYFQTFTETADLKIGRKTIAELAAAWVNDIAGELLRRHPQLRILFGVHATSIRQNLPHLARTDPRVGIVWEDAGGFPYGYNVDDVKDLEGTVRYTRRLADLRPGAEAGFVLKGMGSLNWPTFEHQLGPYVCGRADRDFIRRRAAMAERKWRHLELGWRRNLRAVCRTVQAAVAARARRLSVTGLVEDALWEERMWLPPCLLAEVMWDPREDPGAIVAKVAATRDAYCLA